MKILLCAQGHRHAKSCLSLSVPVKGNSNASAYEEIQCNSVLLSTFGHIEYFIPLQKFA